MTACRTRANRQAAARQGPSRRGSCGRGCRQEAAPSRYASQRAHWLAPQHACAPRRTHTTGLRDNISNLLRMVRRAVTTVRLGAVAMMRRLRRRYGLVVVMRHNHRLWRRNWRRRRRQCDHAGSAALRTCFRCPAQEPARHVPATFAARAPCIAGVRTRAGRQRRDSRERVDRAKRQRADGQNCKCSSV